MSAAARRIALGLAALCVACGQAPLEPLRPDGSAAPAPRADAGAAPEDAALRPDRREPPSCDEAIGAPIVRRLTSTQLTNTLEDFLGSRDLPRAHALVDPTVRGYDVDARGAVIRDVGANQVMLYAEAVAAWAVEHRLDVVAPCQDVSPLCRVQLIRELGLRLFRRPVSTEMLLAYDTLADAEADFESGLEALLSAMLQSPYFLYRQEIGEPVPDEPGVVRLTPYELATALSFFLTNSGPDATLLEAARSGRLSSDEDLDREFDRLIETDRAREMLGRFARQWLGVGDLMERPKDPSVEAFTDEVRASMLRETDALFVHVFESGGGFAALFEARDSFADGPLASFYGVEGILGGAMSPFELEPAGRARGVLGLGSVLARHALADSSSPVQRGALVRRRFLCEELEPPPPSVDTTLSPPMGAVTTRERYRQHTANPFCAGCHRLTDPIGFALGHYDAFGLRRDEEHGHPIDASGLVAETPDGDVPLHGAESLSRYLAASPEARACFAENLAYFAFGVEGCTYASVLEGLAPDTPIREILRRIVHSRHFRYRRVPASDEARE